MDNLQSFDVTSYIYKTKTGPCFICEMISGNSEYYHHIIYENENAIVFLNKYPTLLGYTLVASKEHKEQVTGDLTIHEYLDLQHLIYRVSEALTRTVPTERMYILSLGSQQGHKHIHWHVAPLPPGVPYEKQQTEALKLENGVVSLSDEEMAMLALQIRNELENMDIS